MRERSQPGSQDAASTSRVSWRLATPELEEQDAKLRKEVWLTAGWSPRLSSLAEQGSLPWNLPRPCLCAGQVRTDSRTRLSPRRRAERRADPGGCVGWGSKLGASILLFPVEKRRRIHSLPHLLAPVPLLSASSTGHVPCAPHHPASPAPQPQAYVPPAGGTDAGAEQACLRPLEWRGNLCWPGFDRGTLRATEK